jgi:sugar (pentulose or hexulose) kinase
VTDSPLFLAVDSGTQSTRAILFDRNGAVHSIGRKQHPALSNPSPGALEQDPYELLEAVTVSIRDCLDCWIGDRTRIVGGALTTQRVTTVPTLENGEPAAPAINWLDRRLARLDLDEDPLVRWFHRLLGRHMTIGQILSRSIPRQIRQRDPALYERTRWFLPIEGWLHLRMVGVPAVAPGGATGVLPLDVKKRAWSNFGLLHRLTCVEPRRLPAIVEVGKRIGGVTPAFAQATGLPVGFPFYACGGDKQAEALGGGVRSSQRTLGGVSLGTASSICVIERKPVQSAAFDWFCAPACEPDAWTHEYMLFRGMWTVRWFARELGRDLEADARAKNTAVEALLCDEAERVLAGSEGVVTWPRWSPTMQHPTETGTTIGLRERHGRAHLFRSLIEGIGFDLRRGRDCLEGGLGRKLDRVRVGGGGSRSPFIVQTLADILGIPVEYPAEEELAARGAAIVVAFGSGAFESVDAAVAAMVPDARLVPPNPANARVYDTTFREVYLPGLKDLRRLAAPIAR